MLTDKARQKVLQLEREMEFNKDLLDCNFKTVDNKKVANSLSMCESSYKFWLLIYRQILEDSFRWA